MPFDLLAATDILITEDVGVLRKNYDYKLKHCAVSFPILAYAMDSLSGHPARLCAQKNNITQRGPQGALSQERSGARSPVLEEYIIFYQQFLYYIPS
ncbi:hypothetical protein DBR11_03110 [Pedobacter sp. HMWF019]|nr:hypothetical protein DBR11_03110 [Pedobacter sp. HMWF019]